ncbi:hypothetical protein ACOSQ4_008201 [Xanthoceras sorbifolium]
MVDTPSAYNIILRRPLLVRTKSVVSIYYHALKFPIGDRVGVIHGNQHLVRKCYAASTNPTAILKHCMQVAIKDDELPQKETMETDVNEEHLEVQEEEDEKRIPKTQEHGTPIDDLEAVSIKDEDPTKMVGYVHLSKGSFRRRANVAQSSSYTGNSSLEHFRIKRSHRTLAVCAMGRGPHWTSPYVQRSSEVCNHRSRLFHTMGRS